MAELKEGLVTGAMNLFFIYKFLRILTTPWKESDAFKLGIVDEVLKEPSGGNNWAPLQAGETLKNALQKHLSELLALSPDELRDNRYSKFRKMGKYLESQPIESEISV